MSILKQYVATEEDISGIITDFATFCAFLKERRPLLSKARSKLGKKDLFSLNSLLLRPMDLSGPYYLQFRYPTINLLFNIVLTGGLFACAAAGGNRAYLAPTPKLAEYEALNPFAKYMLLFRIYWTKLGLEDLYSESPAWHLYCAYPDTLFQMLKDARPGERIPRHEVEDSLGREEDDIRDSLLSRYFRTSGDVIHNLSDFGFWTYERMQDPEGYLPQSSLLVKALTPTTFGLAMIRACRKRPYRLYNEQENEGYGEGFASALPPAQTQRRSVRGEKATKAAKEPFEAAFLPIFPANTLDSGVLDALLRRSDQSSRTRSYVFKVSLDRGTWCRIKLAATHTLSDLHQAIQSAFAFDDDHLYAFFMDGRRWSRKAYWGPGCDDPPYTYEAELGQIGLWKGQRFLYLFDFGDEWQFTVLVEKELEEEAPPTKPIILESKGEAPEQYPSWE